MMSTEINSGAEALLRSAFTREQSSEEEARQFYRRWQKAVQELDAVQARLTEVEGALDYKVLHWLHTVLAPEGSFRHRACAGGMRRVRAMASRLGRRLRFSAPKAEPTAKVLDLPAISDSIQADAENPSVAPDPLAYRPDCWSLPDELPPDAEFLDLLILSPVHRTGSTLLQRICNSRKGTLIWGEHGGVLTRFSAIFTDTALFSLAGQGERELYFGQDENPNLWIASMCPGLECVQQSLVNSARALLSTLYGQHRKTHDILGFKEVQYGVAELGLLRRCYPKAQFLLLLRNPLNVWKSTPKDWYPSFDHWIDRYNSGAADYRNFAKNDPNCHLIRYEDLIGKRPETLDTVADVARLSHEQISQVLAHKIGSSRGVSLADADRDVILDRCRDAMEILGYR